MITLSNVSRTFKLGDETIHALNSISLSIKEGAFVAIMGPSGSGKSTFLHLIGGLDQPDKGNVVVGEQDLGKLRDKKLSQYRNKKVGFVFQSFFLQSMLTALENVMLPLYFARESDGKKKELAIAALTAVGLSDRMKHKPNQLSGGQRQRVSIARALVNDPEILLTDEPTGNLDSKTGKEIVALLKTLSKKKKKTVIMVTHDADMARYADRVIQIRDGKIR